MVDHVSKDTKAIVSTAEKYKANINNKSVIKSNNLRSDLLSKIKLFEK